jgi:hypothetical protein
MAKSSLPARAALTSVLLVLAGSAAASETRCVRGDDAIRRVEIAAQDPVQNVPCEVVYWKDTEQPGVRSVLWTAQTDADYCVRKAEELIANLEAGGWSCAAAGEPQSARRQAPPQQQPAPSPPQQAAPSPPQQAAPAPSQQAAPSPPQQAAPSPSQQAAAPDGAAPDPQPSRNAAAAPEVRAALAPQDRVTGETPDGGPGRTALDTIIEENLVRLNDGVDGRFAAKIAGYGDLDGDALEDGVVFFTYESQRLGTARFIAAYLFDGENYALAATKPLAGSDDSVHSADLEAIENGVIAVRLNVLEPGDASCCPSGLRRQSLVLRDGQLAEPSPAASVACGTVRSMLFSNAGSEVVRTVHARSWTSTCAVEL